MKEIEKDLSLIHHNPSTLEEAKEALLVKNQVIEKLKKLVLSGSIHQNVHDISSAHHTNSYEWDYISSENERLQNKVLIIQAEYDLEKTKSEQLKEVT